MPNIHVLSVQVANMIAAGEVVERPASAVKELIENAVDAGATVITVETRQGGIAYIRVTDNGCGIAREDVPTAFLRHATSKIHSEQDLEAINTLGFRGEALASIGAVAKVEMLTKTKDAASGCHGIVAGGVLESCEETGCPDGTTIVVRDLFYNTPARMKFLKKDSTEAAYVADVVQKAAFAHPEVSFKLIQNGKEALFTPGDNKLQSVVYAIYGSEYAKAMVPVSYEKNGIVLQGLVGKTHLVRPNRNYQTFFVNGRSIVNKTLYAALAEAYKNQVMIGKFPVAILHMQVDPRTVDVNVHPSKIEVKFENEQAVYDSVYWACKNALYQAPTVPEMQIVKEKSKENPFSFLPKQTEKPRQMEAVPYFTPKVQKQLEQEEAAFVKEPEQVPYQVKPAEVPAYQPEPKKEAPPAEPPKKAESVLPDFRVIGQLFNTYILVERGEELLVIDQHAAHERLRYESLLADFQAKTIPSQLLLLPSVAELSPTEFAVYEENQDFFERLGFECEAFGGNSVLIRMIPCDMEFDAIGQLFVELLDLLQTHRKMVITEKEQHAMYQIACKSAIKANHSLNPAELAALVGRVLALEGINSCPHGRPITIQMSKYQLEKEFKRIV